MNDSPTSQYIRVLLDLKKGDLGLIRTHIGQRLDKSTQAFDLFTGLWWPLRKTNQRAPRREVAWLVAKLFAYRSVEHRGNEVFARNMGLLHREADEKSRVRFQNRFDELLLSPLDRIESPLQWALDELAANEALLDWVRLTDDLSKWERESVRLAWVREFLQANERQAYAD